MRVSQTYFYIFQLKRSLKTIGNLSDVAPLIVNYPSTFSPLLVVAPCDEIAPIKYIFRNPDKKIKSKSKTPLK